MSKAEMVAQSPRRVPSVTTGQSCYTRSMTTAEYMMRMTLLRSVVRRAAARDAIRK
jgi:hypothetical protein